jgi:hypothetical protein
MDWSNKRDAMAKVSQDGWTLGYASNELKGNKQVLMAAVAHSMVMHFGVHRRKCKETKKLS